MILFFEQRLMAWTSHINVYDEAGEVFCQIQGNLGWAQKYLILDRSGVQIGQVSEKPLNIPSQFVLQKDSDVLATVKMKKGALQSGIVIDNGWNMEGDTASWDWRFRKADGSTAVRMSRNLPGTAGLYGIVIADDVDPVLAVMAVTAVETKRLTQRSRKDKQEMRDEMRGSSRKFKK